MKATYVKHFRPAVIAPQHVEVYEFIEEYIKTNGFSPTLDEIAKAFKKVKQYVHRIVNQLESLGCIRRVPRIPRGIQPVIHPSKVNLNLLNK